MLLHIHMGNKKDYVFKGNVSYILTASGNERVKGIDLCSYDSNNCDFSLK